MGFVGNILGINGNKGSSFNANQANLVDTTNASQIQNSYTQQQQALAQQQQLAQQLAAQNGLQNQSQVYNQEQGIINGTGPNPAMAQLQQQTGNNVANQAALMASQRGAGANAGLIARQAAQQGAATQQQAVGQAATLQAQQQQDAINNAAGIANQQVSNQIGGVNSVNSAALQGQQNILGAGSNLNSANVSNASQANSANAGVQGQVAQQQGGIFSGIAKAAGSALTLAEGGRVPGKANVPGDSLANDKVNAKLSPGEIVIPRSMAKSPEKAADFVKQVLDNKKQTSYKGFEKVSEDENSTTLRHPAGHQIVIANKMLSDEHRGLLKALPKYNAGGMASCYADGGAVEMQTDPDAQGGSDAPPEIAAPVNVDPNALQGPDPSSVAGGAGTLDPANPAYKNMATNEIAELDAKDAAQDAADKAGIQKASFMPESSDQSSPIPQLPQSGVVADRNMALQGIGAEAQAQSGLAKDQAKIQDANIKFQQDQQQSYQQQHTALQQERQGLIKDYIDSKVDPNRLWNNMSSGQQARNIVGILVSGFGGPGNNAALDMLHNKIDQDVQLQKDELGKKNSLLSENLRKFGDLETATNMTKVMHADMISAQLDKAAATAQSPLVRAKAMQAKAALSAQYEPLVQQAAMRQGLQQAIAKSDSNIDPAVAVPTLVPKEHQAAVYSEIQNAQNANKVEGDLSSAFDEAADQNTILKTGAGFVRTPPSVMKMRALFLPMIHDQEGRVNEFEQKTLDDLIPKPGDTSSKINEKKLALQSFIANKRSAPIAKSYGLDLDRFNSTTNNTAMKLDPQDKQKLAIARRNPTDPASQAFLRSRGIK